MTGLDPVTPFLSLIDRIISLIQARKTRRREYFEKIIDPLYSQFVPLGEDMLALFRIARESLHSPKKRWKSDFEHVRELRDKFADARHRLRALGCVIESNVSKKKDRDLLSFVRAISDFFTPRFGPEDMGSEGEVLVYFFHERANAPEQRGRSLSAALTDSELRATIGLVTSELEHSWREIAKRHMELKLKYTVD